MEEGDHIEIGMLGAYGSAMATRFNGYGDIDVVEVGDAPMASMFGLGPRVISQPKTDNVVKLTRARGKKRRRR